MVELRDFSHLNIKPYIPSPQGKELYSDMKNNFEVGIDYSDMGDFYKIISNSGNSSSFSDSFIACPGGAYRSQRIGKYLDRQGIDLVDRRCTRGFTIRGLAGLIEEGTIDDNGFIIPKSFDRPIKVLLLPLNVKYECSDEEVLFDLVAAFLMLKFKTPDREIKLNIIIINGDEGDSRAYHNKYYNEDLGPAPEVKDDEI